MLTLTRLQSHRLASDYAYSFDVRFADVLVEIDAAEAFRQARSADGGGVETIKQVDESRPNAPFPVERPPPTPQSPITCPRRSHPRA
jgi:hypothetical protein